jgi:hypothetical protein
MRTKMAQPRLLAARDAAIRMVVATMLLCAAATAQTTHSQPVTDSSTQASPIQSTRSAPATDSSAQASPITSSSTGAGISIAPHTAVAVRLAHAIDSGHLKNGETVRASLAEPLPLVLRNAIQAGTPVELTVVETLPAGQIYAAGEFSLQVLSVGSVPVYTDTLTYRGEAGHKDLPDSAPAVGTDAGLPSGALLTFRVLPPPTAATGVPRSNNSGPGSVNGVASGAAPPPGSSPATTKGTNSNSNQVRSVQPADDTPGRAQNLGKTSPAPNQPSPPEGSTPTDSTQPR